MVITAKFASHCATCHAAIAAGTKIEWSKGQPARHVTCAAAAGTVSTPAPRTSSSVEHTYRRRYGWDGVRGSASYYSSGMYDEES